MRYGVTDRVARAGLVAHDKMPPGGPSREHSAERLRRSQFRDRKTLALFGRLDGVRA
jgi:hypothetical protein